MGMLSPHIRALRAVAEAISETRDEDPTTDAQMAAQFTLIQLATAFAAAAAKLEEQERELAARIIKIPGKGER